MRTEIAPEPLPLYRTLRHINPAPFSSYLRFGETAVLSSSPERFLSVGRDRWVEAKPIKGTCRRGADRAEDLRLAEELRTDEKTRAENLMITDLLRNDLGVVCDIGTVHVPHLMAIESYETVHQLVSTIRGRLRDDVEPPDGIRACFPGGSMTGAPKKRTMEIIDELEGEARGRLLRRDRLPRPERRVRPEHRDPHDRDGRASTTTIGTGGAIVMQSDAEDEYQEIMLKARALINALAAYAAPGGEIRVHEGESRPDRGGGVVKAAALDPRELLERATPADRVRAGLRRRAPELGRAARAGGQARRRARGARP